MARSHSFRWRAGIATTGPELLLRRQSRDESLVVGIPTEPLAVNTLRLLRPAMAGKCFAPCQPRGNQLRIEVCGAAEHRIRFRHLVLFRQQFAESRIPHCE